jgi:hypothetical protein
LLAAARLHQADGRRCRSAAGYVDRILKGEAIRPAGKAPTKYDLVINLKTAKALGLSGTITPRPRQWVIE